jgi:hypothetical protein
MPNRKYIEFHKEVDGVLYKKCANCGAWIIADNNNFGIDNSEKDKLSKLCWDCKRFKTHEYYMEHQDKQIKDARNNILSRHEEYKKYLKDWRTKNKDRTSSYKKKWDIENKPHVIDYQTDYQKNNPEKFKEYSQYKTMNGKHNISKIEWKACKEYFNNTCAYCGLPINEHYNKYRNKISLHDFHKEHVIHDGNNTLDNCVPSCKSCNSQKRTIKFEDWYNKENYRYTNKRYSKIISWTTEDYKKFISE